MTSAPSWPKKTHLHRPSFVAVLFPNAKQLVPGISKTSSPLVPSIAATKQLEYVCQRHHNIMTQPLYKWPIVARVHPVTPLISCFLIILPWAINYHCPASKPFFFSMGVGVFPQLYVYFFYSCGGKPPLPSGLSGGGEARLAHFHQRFRRAHPILQTGTRYVDDIGHKQTSTSWFEVCTLEPRGGVVLRAAQTQNPTFSRERPRHKL